ncbi:MAG: helix-turn-helix domain-containing protein [Planctomycetes bacterium]|jgi:DNA-binding IclR family transcriptional regulator|nr:helix-turn-helix domain-containing protein [Planctomycetota bacterium]
MRYTGVVAAQPRALHRGLDILELVASAGQACFAELRDRSDIPPASFARSCRG